MTKYITVLYDEYQRLKKKDKHIPPQSDQDLKAGGGEGAGGGGGGGRGGTKNSKGSEKEKTEEETFIEGQPFTKKLSKPTDHSPDSSTTVSVKDVPTSNSHIYPTDAPPPPPPGKPGNKRPRIYLRKSSEDDKSGTRSNSPSTFHPNQGKTDGTSPLSTSTTQKTRPKRKAAAAAATSWKGLWKRTWNKK